VTIQRDYGDRKNRRHARMKYLVEERGIVWFREELERRLGRAVRDPHAIVFEEIDDHLGWHEQADGTWFLGLSVENGRVSDKLTGLLGSALREIAQRFAPTLHITGQQNVLLCGIRAADRDAVRAILRERGIEADPVALGLHRRAMACPALPTCGLAVTDAERALPGLVDEIESELVALGLDGEPISIRMTGCPNGCARPRLGDIGIVGRSLGIYDLFLGGDGPSTRLNALYAQGVKRGELVATLRPIFDIWKRERIANERFGDFVERYGVDMLRSVTKELATA
jgi:sulfite reductase (ferredoxin)